MSDVIRGHVTSFKVFTGRTDLVAIGVTTGTDSGSGVFNCKVGDVRLNGVVAVGQHAIGQFVTGYGTVAATVSGADFSEEGTGFVPCAGIALSAVE